MLTLARAIDSFYAHHPAIAWPLQVVVTVFLVSFLISYLGGWWALAKRYRTGKPMPAGAFLVSGSFRYVAGYNNVIRAASDAEGLSLRFWPRLAHPPLFIPWADIQIKEPRGWLFKSQSIVLGARPAVPFTLSERHVKRLTEQWIRPANTEWPRL